MAHPARWFDGLVAREQPVWVERQSDDLRLSNEHGEAAVVKIADLVRLGRIAGEIRIGHRRIEGWRLVMAEPDDAALLGGLSGHGRLDAGFSRPVQLGLIGLTGVVSLALALLVFAPGLVARRLPASFERKIGAAYDVPIQAMKCNDPAARRALEQIIARIDPHAIRDGFTVELIKLNEANAAALPGGRMVILTGLFDDVKDPDAVAGILAHEIAHVRRRHIAEAMVRQLGLGTIITLLGGGTVATDAGGLLNLRFSRSAEAQADDDAIAALRRAQVDPRPTARAFDHFRLIDGEAPQWLSDHPASGQRARRFAASFNPASRYRPVLDPADRTALVHPCR